MSDHLVAATVPPAEAHLELVDLREHRDDELLRQVHDGLYTESFPAPEREHLDSLREGLWGAERDDPPTLHFFVARSAGGVAGFASCEYYPRSRCGLLSYIAVDAAARGQGLGRTLTERAIEALRRDAAAAGADLAVVFAEIHDPAKLDSAEDVIPPLERVRIMARLGAKRIPIPYVQPELGPGRERPRTLMLIAFPAGDEELDSLPSATVRDFLREYYAVSGVHGRNEDVDLSRSLVGLSEEEIELDPLLPVEEPRLTDIAEYGIGFHLTVRGPKDADGSTTAIASFEDDILAYAYQDPPPFRTQAVEVDDRLVRVAVEFAGEVTFVSEGRRVVLQSSHGADDRVRHFLLRASRTDFENSDLAVLHLVLGPDPGAQSDLDEYDVIKLMKLWQGGEGMSTDGTDAAGERFVSFCVGDERCTIVELANKVFQEKVDPAAPRVGTIQILHPLYKESLCDEINEIREREGGADPPSPAAIAVGGLVQGLLDYGEIDADELADVFKEMDVEEGLARAFHKGTLLVVSASDRAFSAEHIRSSIGLSPYLLVPHAVLLHNEWWLQDAVRRLEDAQQPGWGWRGKGQRLEDARHDVGETLSQRLVANVFHYEEERDLYDIGRRSRGLRRLQEEVEGRLAAVKADIGARHERIRSLAARTIPVLALVFVWSDALAKHDHTLVFAVLIPTTLLTVAALAFVFWRD